MVTPEQLVGRWNYPTSLRFGPGRIRDLAAACRELGMANPLLVTDSGLAAHEIVRKAVEICRADGLNCAVFSDVQANPVEDNVIAGVGAYRSGNHDGVIAYGGGSALDAGKAIALMVGQSRPIWDFEDKEDWYTRVNVAGLAPVIAVPTTAGTGSEVGRCSVLTDLRDHTKKLIFHPRLLPGIVILDPELHVGLPAHITAAVGMDALSHNLEALCAPTFHPMADGIAVEGIRIIREWLPQAVKDGSNIEARAFMLIASTMGATAFQKGLGAMHSLSHPCSANLNTHHGLTNGVVMPYVLSFNRRAIKDKMKRLAAYMGFRRPRFASILDWVLELRQDIGIPHTLAALGVTDAHAAPFAKMAVVDPSTATNPVRINARKFEQLYRNAIIGSLS